MNDAIAKDPLVIGTWSAGPGALGALGGLEAVVMLSVLPQSARKSSPENAGCSHTHIKDFPDSALQGAQIARYILH
jgi:hypothetical protein